MPLGRVRRAPLRLTRLCPKRKAESTLHIPMCPAYRTPFESTLHVPPHTEGVPHTPFDAALPQAEETFACLFRLGDGPGDTCGTRDSAPWSRDTPMTCRVLSRDGYHVTQTDFSHTNHTGGM